MRYIIIPIITLLFLAAILYNPGKESWENVGPQWACMLNPAKYPELCKERK